MSRPNVPHPVSDVYEVSGLDRALKAVPRDPGVYAFYAKDLPQALASFSAPSHGLTTLYVGQTGDSLNRRIEHHLFRDARVSTLRGNLGLLVQAAMGLELIRIPGQRHFCFRDEAPISAWLAQHTLVGFSVLDNPTESEAAWLALDPGLLNIKGRSPTALSENICEMRHSASGRHLPIPVP